MLLVTAPANSLVELEKSKKALVEVIAVPLAVLNIRPPTKVVLPEIYK